MMDPKLFAMLIDTFKIELSECHQEMVDALLQLEKCVSADEAQESLKQLFRISHNIKGSSKSVGIDTIAAIAHELEDSFSLWREKSHVPNKQEMDRCLTHTDQLLVLMENYLNEMDSSNKPTEKKDTKGCDDQLKIPLSRVEIANAKANEFVTYRLKLSSWLKQLNHSLEHILNIEDSLSDEQRQLITSLSKLKDDGAQFYGEFSRSLNALQNELRAMRLLPINHVLIPLERTVRDVAGSLGKNIVLKITGGDIELDKSILDLIKSPLQHLIRNSIGHGIEENDVRKKLNKPTPAALTIKVSHVSGKIQVLVEDDGQGLDVEKITKRALSQNLIKQEQLDALNHDEKLDLIFLSGFSTKQNITELSGRGVGLDIVRANIQKIKGSVSVKSTLNKGTSFCMKLPLTLATTRGLFITVNEHTLMLPTLSINTLYHVKTDELKSINQQEVLIIDDTPIPVMLLSRVLNMRDDESEIKTEYHGVMVGDHQQRMILLVDTISDEHDCVINPVPPPLNKVPHLIGVTLTGSGNLVLVLDVNCLMNYAITKDIDKVIQTKKQVLLPSMKQRILVVDDSITTRTLAVHSLEAAGFETMNAINGKLAWQLVKSETFDCVVTDVDMPVMNGFDFTHLIKSSSEYQNLPVIIVTSRASDKDKEKGLEVGADAYLVKNQFDTRTLIQMIESLL